MKNIIKSLLFTLITILFLCLITEILRIKPTVPTMKEFYLQDKNEIQVIGLGTSHIVHSLSPMRMYEKSGITSYVCGTPNQLIEASYYVLSEVYKSQTPEVVILEIASLFYADGQKARGSNNRALLDQMAFSVNRFMLSHEIANYGNDVYRDTFTTFFPLYTYHSRWKELTKDDMFISECDNKTKGFQFKNQIYKKNAYRDTVLPDEVSDIEADFIPGNNKKYLTKIKELCEKKGSRLVFISTPSEKWTVGKEKAIIELSQELGIEYLNLFFKDDVLIDYDEDMGDRNHVNTAGGEKITDFLTDYLVNNCGVKPRGNVKDYDDAVRYYDRYVEISNIQLETDVYEYIDMLIYENDRFDYALCVQRDEYELFSPAIKEKLKSFGIDGSFEDGNVYTAFFEGGEQKYSECINYQTETSYESKRYGKIDFLIEEDMPSEYNTCDCTVATYGGLNILLFDRESGLKIDYVIFRIKEGEENFKHLSPDKRTKDDPLIDYRRWLLRSI